MKPIKNPSMFFGMMNKMFWYRNKTIYPLVMNSKDMYDSIEAAVSNIMINETKFKIDDKLKSDLEKLS